MSRPRKRSLPKLGWRKRVGKFTEAIMCICTIDFPVNSRKDYEYLVKLNRFANIKFKK